MSNSKKLFKGIKRGKYTDYTSGSYGTDTGEYLWLLTNDTNEACIVVDGVVYGEAGKSDEELKETVNTLSEKVETNTTNIATNATNIATNASDISLLKKKNDSVLTKDVIVTTNVGYIKSGETLKSGTSLETIIENALSKEEWAETPNPKYELSYTINGLPSISVKNANTSVILQNNEKVEVGTKLNVTSSNVYVNTSSVYQKITITAPKYGYYLNDKNSTILTKDYEQNLTPSLKSGVNGSSLVSTYRGTTKTTKNYTYTHTQTVSFTDSNLVCEYGKNEYKLTETIDGYNANTNVTKDTLYICTNKGNVTKSETDKSDNTLAIEKWDGETVKTATATNSFTINGDYYYWIGSTDKKMSSDFVRTQINPATQSTTLPNFTSLKSGFCGTSVDLGAATYTTKLSYYPTILVPSTHKLTKVTNTLGTDLLSQFTETANTAIALNGTSYRIYQMPITQAAAGVIITNIKIAKV